MAKKDKKISKIKVKKKTWFKINAPKLFGNREIGESYLTSVEKAVGRSMKVNLRDLTGNVKDQNVYIGLRISGVQASALQTSVISYQLTPAYVKRAVRKNAARLDDYFTLKTKTGQEVILKAFIITFGKATKSTRTALRNKFKELLKEEISRIDFSTFVGMMVSFRLQSSMKRKLKKVFPVKEATVRVIKLKEAKGVKSEPLKVVPEEVVEAKKAAEEETPKAEAKEE